MLVVAVALVALGVAAGAPLAVTAILAVLALMLVILHGARRDRRRRELARRRREMAAQQQARRAVENQQRRQARREAIKQRYGIDVALVQVALRDLAARSRTHGNQMLRAGGRRLNEVLEKRYGPVPAPASRPEGPAVDWLDLDADFGALQSRMRTEEILRLSRDLVPPRG